MESVVATVSGYHGTERFNLIKLISQAGASYVGTMTRSVTHLVCWKFEGRKYKLAKKFKIVIVNHRWVEECIKQGKRVAERPFMLQSGQEVGPLLTEVPIIDKLGALDKVLKRFSDKSGCGDHGLDAWADSILLKEVHKMGGSSDKSKPTRIRSRSSQKHQPSGRYADLMRFEPGDWTPGTSRHSGGRSKISGNEDSGTSSNKTPERGNGKFDGTGRTSLDAPCKRRRLVKNNARNDNLETVVLDSDEECHSVRHQGQNDQTASILDQRSNKGKLQLHETGTSDFSLKISGGSNRENFGDTVKTRDFNPPLASNNVDSCLQDMNSPLERIKGHSAVEDTNGKSKDDSPCETVAGLPTSMDLSCVICWTDFSSSRGILPCGHRYCYNCIENWATHKAASKKSASCPLCKASFDIITKVEDAATYDQKIFSQTIPCPSSTANIFIVADQERNTTSAEFSLATVCGECRCREPEDLLQRCHVCQSRCIHSYCLDPPLFPWICAHCKDLQLLFQNNS